jgi:hypothetical protein
MEMTGRSDTKEQRKRAAKTAWLLAAIATLIFIAFILAAVLGS